jgi:hypothetical protein
MEPSFTPFRQSPLLNKRLKKWSLRNQFIEYLKKTAKSNGILRGQATMPTKTKLIGVEMEYRCLRGRVLSAD